MKTTDILKTIAKISVLAIILKALDPELTFKYKVDESQTSGSAS